MVSKQLWVNYKLYCYKNGYTEGNYKVFREFMIKNFTI